MIKINIVRSITVYKRKFPSVYDNGMKKILLFLSIACLTSCVTTEKSHVREDSLLLTRKYVGQFVEYRQHVPEKIGEPYLIWIKTTMDSTYGKISAYGNKCNFKPGENLYIRRTEVAPGTISSFWEYHIESYEGKVSYRLSDYQYDRKNMIQNWF